MARTITKASKAEKEKSEELSIDEQQILAAFKKSLKESKNIEYSSDEDDESDSSDFEHQAEQDDTESESESESDQEMEEAAPEPEPEPVLPPVVLSKKKHPPVGKKDIKMVESKEVSFKPKIKSKGKSLPMPPKVVKEEIETIVKAEKKEVKVAEDNGKKLKSKPDFRKFDTTCNDINKMFNAVYGSSILPPELYSYVSDVNKKDGRAFCDTVVHLIFNKVCAKAKSLIALKNQITFTDMISQCFEDLLKGDNFKQHYALWTDIKTKVIVQNAKGQFRWGSRIKKLMQDNIQRVSQPASQRLADYCGACYIAFLSFYAKIRQAEVDAIKSKKYKENNLTSITDIDITKDDKFISQSYAECDEVLKSWLSNQTEFLFF